MSVQGALPYFPYVVNAMTLEELELHQRLLSAAPWLGRYVCFQAHALQRIRQASQQTKESLVWMPCDASGKLPNM